MSTWQRDSGLLVREDLVERESGLLVQAGTYKDPLPPIGFDAATVRARYDPTWDEPDDPPPEPLSPLAKHYQANPMDAIMDDIFLRAVAEGLREVMGPPASPCNHPERGMYISVCEGCNSSMRDQSA